MRRVHQAQQLVGQRHVLQDLVGQGREVLPLRIGDALDAADRVRQRRKLGERLHTTQQEVERCVAGHRVVGFGRGRARAAALQPGGQRLAQHRRAAGALRGIARDRTLHGLAQRRIDRLARGGGRRHPQVLALHALERAHRIALDQQAPAADHLGQHHAGGEHVHRRLRRRAARRLGRDVARGAADHAGLVGHARGDAEAHHARAALRVDQHVGRVEVAVHDAALAQVLRQRRPGDVREHQVGSALGLVGLEHRHQVRVRQSHHRARLVQPLVDRGRVARVLQQLERHLAIEPIVVRKPDRRLRAAAEFAQQREAGDARMLAARVHAAAYACASGADGGPPLPELCTAAMKSFGVMSSTRA
jgi:hypothetical protein